MRRVYSVADAVEPSPDRGAARDTRERGRRFTRSWRRPRRAGRRRASARRHRRAGHRSVTHPFATLAFFTGGRTRLELNGEWTLKAGDVLLVPPGRRTAPRARPDGRLAARVLVPASPRRSIVTARPVRARPRRRGGRRQHPRERRAFLASLFRELDALTAADTREAVQHSLVTLILAEVERATSGGGPGRAARGGAVVEALRFIERHCLGPITPRDVAAAVRRSPSHLTTALKQATGRGVGEWIVAGRMAEAGGCCCIGRARRPHRRTRRLRRSHPLHPHVPPPARRDTGGVADRTAPPAVSGPGARVPRVTAARQT